MDRDRQQDIVVVGRGPVGATLAQALAPLAERGLRIAHVGEAPLADDRPIALSWGSRLILEQLGLWSRIGVTPIESIHVSQQGAFGRTLIAAADHGLEALGYVVSQRDLLAALPAAGSIPVHETRVAAWHRDEEGITIQCGEKSMRTQLLVLADGGRLGAYRGSESVKTYDQTAVVCRLQSDRPHANRAWERFAPEGPLALLPFKDGQALVWTARTDTAHALLGLSDEAFLSALQKAFGQRSGQFLSAGPRAGFPLSLRYQRSRAAPGLFLIGNAAQTLHPVAGQGLNLGLRDAWELAELIAHVADPAAGRSALGGSDLAQRYEKRRRNDRFSLIGLTDGLIRAFGLPLPMAPMIRGTALALLDAVPPARRFLSRRMMFGARALP